MALLSHLIISSNRKALHLQDKLKKHTRMKLSKIMYITLILLSVLGTIHGELVRVQHGMLEGISAKTKNNNDYLRFLGIPYAEPPIEKLRFKAPVPKTPWNGIHNATTFASICTQREKFTTDFIIGREDCLFLNVFVPKHTTTKFPVMVMIHGGAFLAGSGNLNPEYFIDKNIAFVTMNYRLAVFGFMSMNNDHITGNFGLKDQVLALKWVKENIAAFGGDPDNITLMGQSAGSVAVHLHMLSPLSKGLFNKAILQSGDANALWSHDGESRAISHSTAFLVAIGCLHKNLPLVLKCLQSLPSEALLQAENRLYPWNFTMTMVFKPVIESNVTDRPFLSRNPADLSITKDIPYIIGLNSGDGMNQVLGYLQNNGSLLKLIDQYRNLTIPLISHYYYSIDPDRMDNVTQKIVDYYFEKNSIGFKTVPQLIQLLRDIHFTYSLIKTVRSSKGPRYVYYYDYTASFPLTKNLGVCHGDEIPMLFRKEHIESKWTQMDTQMSHKLVNFWSNFAIHSDPNGSSNEKIWTPVESDGIEYLHISNNEIIMKKDLLKERYEFWDSLSISK